MSITRKTAIASSFLAFTLASAAIASMVAPPDAPPPPAGKDGKDGKGEGKRMPRPDFKTLDKDGDGFISEAEAGPAWERLKKADTNADGKISKDEFEAFGKLHERGGKNGEKPKGDKPGTDKPAGDKPAGDKPAGDKPAGDKPTGTGNGAK